MDHNPQSQLKLLIAQGKEQGYLTYAEVNDSLAEELVDADQDGQCGIAYPRRRN